MSVLALFAKLPVAGRVKTRLIPALGAEGAAKLAEGFLLDLVERLAGSLEEKFECVLCFDPPDAEAAFRRLLADVPGAYARFEFVAQNGGDLGERLGNALAAVRTGHSGPYIFIGTDAPDLALAELQQAVAVSSGESAYLVSADDGGYVLVALPGHAPPEVFRNIEWSSSRTCADQLRQLVRCGMKPIVRAASWPDVDEAKDLSLLEQRLEREPAIAPRTLAFLRSIKTNRS